MKFLCLECNTTLKFKEATTPDQGSLTAVFACPDCCSEIAMYLNQWETKLLQSLDLKLGGSEKPDPKKMMQSFLGNNKQGSSTEATSNEDNPQPAQEGSKCPFAAMLGDSSTTTEETPTEETPQIPDPPSPPQCPVSPSESADLIWTEEAQKRLDKIPSFAQSMAKAGIESLAREKGMSEIDTELMDRVRQDFGM